MLAMSATMLKAARTAPLTVMVQQEQIHFPSSRRPMLFRSRQRIRRVSLSRFPRCANPRISTNLRSRLLWLPLGATVHRLLSQTMLHLLWLAVEQLRMGPTMQARHLETGIAQERCHHHDSYSSWVLCSHRGAQDPGN